MSKKKIIVDSESKMNSLVEADELLKNIPQVGDIIKAKVISASKKEVLLDFNGAMTGLVRGKELYNESEEFAGLKPGDETEATVLEPENEQGLLELSFRYAGHQKTWATLKKYRDENKAIEVKINDANKGGLLVTVNNAPGFLPVSQLSPEYYPRVQGGDKNKILEQLKSYIGKSLPVKIIDVNEEQEKLIVSEKAAWEEAQKDVLMKYKINDVVEGKITAVTDFGVFVEFGENLEGLIHISELAWQRIDDPKSLYSVGDEIKAEIIKIDGSKIFLSSKKLKDDPWKGIEKKFKLGDIVEGEILKTTPFGLFVQLDNDIHGLAHISELSEDKIASIDQFAKTGSKMKFRIVSIEPKEHRLGLSAKDLDKPYEAVKKEVKEEVAEEDVKETVKEKPAVEEEVKEEETKE
ncbi:S1 RNA-binding domain-containing protein [Candidatus Kuenenbacteria bacterium]|nr:S1 RNA-binding domain-containing protein [Candidatus Kuenenbacteria bacterium]